MDLNDTPTPSEDLVAALSGSQGVLALTDDGRAQNLVIVRRFGALLAAALGTTLFLADRSQRTWADTPHVRGPADIDYLRGLGIDHMVEQMEEATSLGAREVLGVAPSMPNFDALRDSLRDTEAQVLVMPTKLDNLKLTDRLQFSGDLAIKVKEVVKERHVVSVNDKGTITLL